MPHRYPRFSSLILFCLLGGVACQQQMPAPIYQAHFVSLEQPRFHRVSKGETLYAVSFLYGLDYRELAKMNHIKSPYALSIGQILRLKQPSHKKSQGPMIKKQIVLSNLLRPRRIQWYRPTQGVITRTFSLAQNHKGIDITGHRGQAIHASRAGRVAYCGSGLTGYGNLLIIKHDNEYLTAYAHNQRVLVKEGQWIKENAKIAEMGNSGTRDVHLHFEIRKAGRPVNPAHYLK